MKFDDDDETNPKYFFKIRFKRKSDEDLRKESARKKSALKMSQKSKAKSQGKSSEDFVSYQFSSDASNHTHGHGMDHEHEEDGHSHHQCSSHEDLIEPLMQQHTFEEKLDQDDKYQFVMYSPSYEIFKRMHAVLSHVPEIVQNME